MESRVASMKAERARLIESWKPIIDASRTYLKKDGRELDEFMAGNIARCCENALLDASKGRNSKLFETTDSSNVDFLGIQLPVIAALLPSLALNELATVQALERRVAGVFYMNVKYGTAKGAIAGTESMISATTGHYSTVSGRRYASQRVSNEVTTVTTTSGQAANCKTGTLGFFPVVAGSLTIVASALSEAGVATDFTFVDDGEGVLVLDGASLLEGGHVHYTTGVFEIILPVVIIGSTVTTNYKYNYETGGKAGAVANNVPEVNFDIVEDTLTAEDFPLKALYTLTAAIDLERAHGISLEDEVVKYLGNEVKFTMDHLGIDMLVDAAYGADAATTAGAFDATVDSGQEWIWRKYQFIDFVEKANINIIAKTLRMMCTWIVVGNDGARVIRQLAPNFSPASGLNTNSPTGPYVLGTLDGRTVVHDPFITANKVIFGWKGDSYLQSAFVFAPYIPLLTTPTLVTADLKSQKGFLSSAAYKVINPGAMCYGTVSGLT